MATERVLTNQGDKDFDQQNGIDQRYIEKAYNEKNCTNCNYSQGLADGDVLCNRQHFTNKDVVISKDNILDDCPCHSDYNRLESRDSHSNNYMFESDDTCAICHRENLTNLTGRKNNKRKFVCNLCYIQQERRYVNI